MCQYTGHKMYWYDHDEWLERQKSFTKEFWDKYREEKQTWLDLCADGSYHDKPKLLQEVSTHFKAAAKWDRMALNAVTQGTGIICLKEACVNFFKYIVTNKLFGIVKIVDLVHDEICIEYPETMPEMSNILQENMEAASAKYCKKLPIPAEPAVGLFWIH